MSMSASETVAYLERAVRHLVSFAKDRVGLDLEMGDWGIERTGKVDFKEIDPEYLKEFEQILFSCHVASTLMGFTEDAQEYPRIVRKLEKHLSIARLGEKPDNQNAPPRRPRRR